jgi:1,2-dihydroxy-3-keto-5-methylthiopentene dioxygenase
MSELRIYRDNSPKLVQCVSDPAAMAAQLATLGIRYERWVANQVLSATAAADEVLAAYAEDVARLVAEFGFQSVDVVSLTPDHPQAAVLRQKFLSEHVHDDFEVRFFVDGSGLFYIHAQGQVFGMLCEAGDLLCIPANVTHWFDMGAAPHFKCIRLFTTPEGWVARFTGSEIGKAYPFHGESFGAAA